MVELSTLVDDFLINCGRIHIFCETRQLSKWLRVLSQMKMDVPDTSDASEKNISEDLVFNVETKPRIYNLCPGVYLSKPLSKKMFHMNVTENASHDCKNGNSSADDLFMVNYNFTYEVISSLPMWTNLTTNFPLLEAGEQLFITSTAS